MTKPLINSHCQPCHGDTPALDTDAIKQHMTSLDQWSYDEQTPCISKRYSFKNFYHTMSFVNAIAWMANQQGHHPDIQLGYNYCNVQLQTHAIHGLSLNDFICAAKIDQLMIN